MIRYIQRKIVLHSKYNCNHASDYIAVIISRQARTEQVVKTNNEKMATLPAVVPCKNRQLAQKASLKGQRYSFRIIQVMSTDWWLLSCQGALSIFVHSFTWSGSPAGSDGAAAYPAHPSQHPPFVEGCLWCSHAVLANQARGSFKHTRKTDVRKNHQADHHSPPTKP